MNSRPWLLFALATTVLWGIWGALIDFPEKAGFPATLGYVVWSLTMLPVAAFGLARIHWVFERDRRSVVLGAVIGFSGAGGTLLLFQALRSGPPYLIFPIVSLYPMLTVVLSLALMHERVGRRGGFGIALAAPAMVLLAWQPSHSHGHSKSVWLALAILVFVAWGVQAYFMKLGNQFMQAESVFFYMAITGVMLIPVAIGMTDFGRPINWGFSGPWLAMLLHFLNAAGALCLVYAMRYGKAIIVAPMTALAPLLTVVLSLAINRVAPEPLLTCGIVLASAAIVLMAE